MDGSAVLLSQVAIGFSHKTITGAPCVPCVHSLNANSPQIPCILETLRPLIKILKGVQFRKLRVET